LTQTLLESPERKMPEYPSFPPPPFPRLISGSSLTFSLRGDNGVMLKPHFFSLSFSSFGLSHNLNVASAKKRANPDISLGPPPPFPLFGSQGPPPLFRSKEEKKLHFSTPSKALLRSCSTPPFHGDTIAGSLLRDQGAS